MPVPLWGVLTPAQIAHAHAFARLMQQTAAALHLPQIRGRHTADEWYQKRVGAEGEVAFRVLTGRPLPSPEVLAATWKGADVDGYSVKTIGRRHYRLIFHESDLEPAHSLVLVYNDAPRFAIMGRITVERARQVRIWADDLPRPCWAVPQHQLESWQAREVA